MNKPSFALRTGIIGVLSLAACFASASPTFWANQNILSSVRDGSNLAGGITGYDLNLTTDGADSDLYINNIGISAGSNWDSNIDLAVDLGGTSYTLGNAITGGSFVSFNNLAVRYNEVNPLVNVGVYDFNVDFFGGADNAANDLVASVALQLEVFQRYDFTLIASASPSMIPQGAQSTVSMFLQNDMASRELVTTTWYVGGSGFHNGSDTLSFDGFAGDWFSKHLNPGESRSDAHSIWGASASQPLGVYDGSGATGVVGGLYDGDFYFLPSTGTSIEVVPEPASLLAILGGVAVLARRRRK